MLASPDARWKCRLLLVTAGLVAATDAVTKALAEAPSPWMPVHLAGGWALQVAHNPGVILGLGAGTAAPRIFAAVAAVEIAWLLFIGRNQGPWWFVALGLMLGGAVANMGEQLIFGYVVDWIRPPQPPIVFNLADVAIASGQLLLLGLLVFGSRASKVRPRAAVTR